MRDATFNSNGVTLHYVDDAAGAPIILVHGFAASLTNNWIGAGWCDALRPVRRVIALDCRGHGESEKPYDPALYALDDMADDVVRLMDHLGIEKADLFGYSMGGGISVRVLARHSERLRSVVLGGVGEVQTGPRRRAAVAEAMTAGDTEVIDNPVAKGLRIFAERLGNDLKALAALQRGERGRAPPGALAQGGVPVLIVNGENDAIVSNAEAVAGAIPGARLMKIPGKDHLTVVPDPRFKKAVVDFLTEPR